jgi:hypothetical protein
LIVFHCETLAAISRHRFRNCVRHMGDHGRAAAIASHFAFGADREWPLTAHIAP